MIYIITWDESLLKPQAEYWHLCVSSMRVVPLAVKETTQSIWDTDSLFLSVKKQLPPFSVYLGKSH